MKSNFISTRWDRFLTEGEVEHFPWLKEIKNIDPEELRDWMNNSDHFIQVGRGSFRGAYVPLEDQDYVIKVVGDLDKYKMQMNKDDFETAKRYPLIFPKAYAHADDFSWIVMEYTRPITWPSQMQKVLDQSFPKEQEALLKVADKLKFNPPDPFRIMKWIMASFRSDREINEASGTTLVTARHGRSTSKDDDRAARLQKTLAPEARGWFAGKMAMGPAYQELSKAMHEFEIDKAELGRGNIGFDKDYNFKIIDSSVFSSDPEEGGW